MNSPARFKNLLWHALPFAGCLVAASAHATTYTYRIPMGGLRATAAAPAASVGVVFQDNTTGNPLPSIAFPDTKVGNSATITVKIANTGTVDVTFDAPAFASAAPFSIGTTDCSGTLVAAASCTASVVFTPTAAQSFTGALSTNSDQSPAASLSAAGTGLPGTTASEVIAGESFTFARRTDGTWVASGDNGYGNLGLGATYQFYAFTAVPGLSGVTQITPGAYRTFARKSDGTWLGAGYNGDGGLGLGDKVNRTAFTPIPGLTGATKVVAGSFHTFAQMSDGSWWAAGLNSCGELGLGDTLTRTSFTKVTGLAGATQVAASEQDTYAQMSDGSWRVAGCNGSGELGVGDYARRNSLTVAPALAGATQVVANTYVAFARKADGSWVAAGENSNGQLGTGDYDIHPTFTAVPGLTGATRVVASGRHSFGQLADGSWRGAGDNGNGQIGLGTFDWDYPTHTPVPVLAGATHLAVGKYYTVARQTDGLLWGAGQNSYGQLGRSSTTNVRTFVPLSP